MLRKGGANGFVDLSPLRLFKLIEVLALQPDFALISANHVSLDALITACTLDTMKIAVRLAVPTKNLDAKLFERCVL
jgi:hypothetical protein